MSHSSECPECKRPCALSELKKINIQNKSQLLEKTKQPRGKPRGAMAKHSNTRNYAKNLFSEVSQNTLSDNSLNPETDSAALLTPVRCQSPPRLVPRNSNSQTLVEHLSFQSNSVQQHNLQDRSQHNVQQPITGPNSVTGTFPHPSLSFPNSKENRNIFSEEKYSLRSDRITMIIQNWNIKFDGSLQGISVDEFLYRVRVLTLEHFNNDFSLIC